MVLKRQITSHLNKKSKTRQRRGTNRTTMQDVAKQAQVSASTVSLYLRDPKGVSPSKASQIKAAIDKLNYVPNLLAGGLAATKTRVIAVIVPSLTNAFFAQTVSAMQRYLDQKGYQLLIGDSDYDEDKEYELAKTFLAWSPLGLVMTGAKHSDACERLLKSTQTKIVQTWELTASPDFFQVGFSHYNVGRLAASHLFSLGKKKVAYVAANLSFDRRATERGQGFCETWDRLAKEPPTIIDIEGQVSPVSGVKALSELLSQAQAFDAVFCSNDIIAMGLMLEATRRDINIPNTLSVISFGDLPFAEILSPGLTTIRPPSELIGQHAIDAILDSDTQNPRLLQGLSKEGKNAQVDLAFELVIRGSS